jgi:hypothetical protein
VRSPTTGSSAQPRIEHVGAVPAVEPAGLVAVGDDEQLRRDEQAIVRRRRRERARPSMGE